MDSKRFDVDDVARSLYVAAPRRGVLTMLLGGALGLGSLATSQAKGKGKGKGKGQRQGEGQGESGYLRENSGHLWRVELRRRRCLLRANRLRLPQEPVLQPR